LQDELQRLSPDAPAIHLRHDNKYYSNHFNHNQMRLRHLFFTERYPDFSPPEPQHGCSGCAKKFYESDMTFVIEIGEWWCTKCSQEVEEFNNENEKTKP